jgi:hypothetical protein
MTTVDVKSLYNRILASTLDEVTKVHLFKILDREVTVSECHLIMQLLAQNERHKFVDTNRASNFNPP